jgi:hypothetical protein
MKRKNLLVVSTAILLIMACSVTTQTSSREDTSAGQITAGSEDFGAEATSANSVLLIWPAAAGAEKYLLDLEMDSGEFLPVAELAADQTSYEHIGVPEAFKLTYRLRVQTASETSAGLTLTITTPEATPDPLSVQGAEYANITWEPPTPDPSDPIPDPSLYYPPGFDPEHPEDFDPSSLMVPVRTSGEIGPEGGRLSITTPDGITLELIIPPGALEDSTNIQLIPIETIGGLPFTGGLAGAVRIEPDGLLLEVPATLRITRPDETPLPEGMVPLAFGFDGSGGEFHLQPLGPADQAGSEPVAARAAGRLAAPRRAGPLSEIALQQLKGYGVGAGTAKQAAEVVKKHAPTAAEARVLQELAVAQLDQLGDDDLAPILTRERLATSRLLSLAQSKDPDWSQMTVSLAQLEILTNYYGKNPKLAGDLARIMDLLLDRLAKMLKENPEKCLTGDDPYAQAVARKLLGAKPGSIYDTMRQKLDPQILKDVAERRKKCVLALELKSSLVVDVKMVGKYDIVVTGRVDGLAFNFRNGKVFLTGTGSLSYPTLETLPEKHEKDWCDPWTPDNRAAVVGEVVVTRMDLVIEAKPNGVLQGVKLFPMTVTDSDAFKGNMTCHNIDDRGHEDEHSLKQVIPAFGGSVWHGYFTAAHKPKLTLDFIVWSTDDSDSIIARYLSYQPEFSPGYGSWFEDTTFTLVNTGS